MVCDREEPGRNGVRRPYCSGNKVLAGFNDLATTRPDLAVEWNPDPSWNTRLPTEVSAGSNYKAGWVCAKSHLWRAVVSGRSGREARGCPDCALVGTSRAEQALYALLATHWVDAEHRAKVKVPGRRRPYEVDVLWGRVVVEYDGSYFHQGAAAMERDLSKTKALLARGYLVVRVREQNNHLLTPLPLSDPDLAQFEHRFGTDQTPLVERLVTWVSSRPA